MGPDALDHHLELGKSGAEDPDHQLLYHYTSAASALEKVLIDGTLRFSPSLSMSDPVEHSPPLVLVTDREGNPVRRELVDEINATLNRLRSHMSQLSLTMDAAGFRPPLGRGYGRARMWDRYGAGGCGVCLAFSAAEMTGAFLDSARRFGAVNCRWVDYDDDTIARQSRVLQIDGLSEQNYARLLTDFVMDNESELFFTKLLEWETEFEYRLLMFNPAIPPGTPVHVPFGHALQAIILGASFDIGHRDRVLALAAKFRARVIRLRWLGGIPSVEPLDEASPAA
jgi:Protein of unknown function (DUF2971)